MSKQSIKDLLFARAMKAMEGFEKSVKLSEEMLQQQLGDMTAMFGEAVVNALLRQHGHSRRFSAKVDKPVEAVEFEATPSKVKKVAKIKAPEKKSSKTVPKKRRSKKAAASLVTQGTYMSLLRKVPDSERERMKKLAKESGRGQAIIEMTALIKK